MLSVKSRPVDMLQSLIHLFLVFAWDAYERGADVHLEADPTKLALLSKEFKVKKEDYEKSQKEGILDKVFLVFYTSCQSFLFIRICSLLSLSLRKRFVSRAFLAKYCYVHHEYTLQKTSNNIQSFSNYCLYIHSLT